MVNGVCARSTLWELFGLGLGSCQTSSACNTPPGRLAAASGTADVDVPHTQKQQTHSADTVSASARQRGDGQRGDWVCWLPSLWQCVARALL